MEAFAIEEFGEPGSIREVSVPDPHEGEVRIRVAAAGVNPFDNAVVQGFMKGHMEHRFPLVPGMDASGVVEAIGSGVSTWAVGDEVFGSVGKMYLGEGTLAELATMSSATIAEKPAPIDHAQAAAVPTAGVAALQMVDTAAVSEGDVVVAIGATGGVGSYLVQLAARLGGRVVAVCRGENAGYAKKLGASDVIDYSGANVVDAIRSSCPDGVDAVADMHGDKDLVARLAEQVRPKGHVVSAVGAADVEALGQRGIDATNIQGRVTTETLESLAGMLEKGEIVSPELRSFTLADASAALAEVATGHTRGKILVVPS